MNRRPRRKPSARNSQQPYSNTACALLLAGAVAGVTAIGCGWSFVNEHSVRFAGYTTADFTRLPPLPINPKARREDKPVARRDGEDEEFELEEKIEREMNGLWTQAGEAEEKSDFSQTGRLLREYLQRASTENDVLPYGGEKRQLRRNSAIDRLDALTALGQGVKPSALSAYLAVRRDYDLMLLKDAERSEFPYIDPERPETPASIRASFFEGWRQKLDSIEQHPALADNIAYFRAALIYREEKIGEAAQAFTELAVRYPRSEKREAALYMYGVALLKLNCPPGDNGGQDDSGCDEAQVVREAFRRVLREYPRGRYVPDARGWLAQLALREGNRAAALAEYYRLLSEALDARTKASLLASLSFTRHLASEEDMRQVETELAGNPAAALTYAYHNIYNYASSSFDISDFEGQSDESGVSDESDDTNEREEKDFSRRIQRQELSRIVAFTSKLLARYTHTAVSGGFALRLAQSQLELGEYKAGLLSATRALHLGVKDRERTEALWVKGSSEWRLRDYAAARRTLKQLVSEFPNSDLAEGAGRLIAMAAEDAGDLDDALEQYIALNYEDDFAYFVDVLMTPEQLAGFIARHPSSPRLNDINYALAVRYLRAKRWAEARSTLARVKVTEQDSADQFSSWVNDDPIEFRSSRRTAKVPSDAPGIAARWLWRDLKTAEDLERMEREATEAQGDEAKAEALYQLASYLYQGSSLLFYNPGLWGGVRHYKLEELESSNGYRAPGEAQLLWRHALEHEPVAHALEIYLDVVRRFPNTRAARDALYTAAVCHERLSDYNSHWRDVYGMGLHAGARMVTYKDVRQAYPNYQLPRGTIGWDPMWRTVKGGPAWAEKPKPKPRLTWRSRVKERLANLAVEFRQKKRDADARLMEFTGRLVKGLIYSLVAVSLLAACYFAAVGLYLRNQRPMFAPMFEEERIATTASDCPTSSTDSRVEKIINN